MHSHCDALILAEHVNGNESESCVANMRFEISSRPVMIGDSKKDCLMRIVDCTLEFELAGLLMNILNENQLEISFPSFNLSENGLSIILLSCQI